MSVPRPIYVLTFCLIAGLLAAASPARAERAKNFNDAQLKLLFSGTEVAGEGSCQLIYPGDLFLDFTFHKDGRFFVDYDCVTAGGYEGGDAGNTTGTWSIEENELCTVFKYPGLGWENVIQGNCYSVRHDRSGFGFYSRAGRFLELTFKHHRFPTKGKLLTAVLNLSGGGTGAVASTKTEKTPKIKTMARSVTLPPAPYKAPLVGTKIKYDDRIYRVTRTDGFLTVYRSVTGAKLSYLNAYALFGEYADNLYVTHDHGFEISYKIDTDNRKKLEAFWPLEAGKKTKFEVIEEDAGIVPLYTTYGQSWVIALEVAKAEAISLNGINYSTYVIVEEAKSGDGFSFVGRKWYHPTSGLIVKAERTWTKIVFEPPKIPNFAEGDEDNYTLVKVRFPEGTIAVAAKQEPKAPPAVSTAELARLEREAEEKRKARAAEIARLEREAEKKRQASARKAEAEQKARTAELAHLEREAEEKRLAAARKAEAEQKAREVEIARLAREEEKAREAEEKAGTAAQKEIARLKREAVEAKKASLAEVARQKREAAEARDAEVASLRQQLEEALKARKIVEAPKAKAKAADGLAGIKFGNYHALIIGINNYKNLPKLTTAINDAKGVAKVLKDEYGFKVTTLIDPDRLDIIDAFDELKETLTDEDNLLIYYAGHGWLDEDTDRGYWLPVDAKPKRRSRWVSNATITDTLKGLSAKHVLVLADSCYSGTLTRAADVGTRKRKGDYWKKMASKWARVAITSGGLEPVADKGGGDHSPFAKAFIDVLQENASIMDGVQLFGKMRRPVMVAAEQTPQYSDVRNAGHDGGDFLFVRKK
ncbi:MAG: hypothetical protein CFH04_01572 [Alphaproteobacteria bacterium MarineAlpha3_Bin3]|nr:MAG: hypothetical protein CFH04_01572 [Alphaproteobacteria bacterium MarineAlpha3_Bin3]